ncbi:hypothetical protein ACU5B6_25550 [Moritella viscosa]|uniref:hypothetical protein n=1 Tax=Moritella viscosa TaxID=80854 RepID=UPI00091A68FB|nr:hypothetical protein [Moritella viscosa]SHN99805.1 DNA-directed DNA polymerase I [Moritella viscosa]SHN99826.1 DNA-directed DNA polymerase I [Moritella viscosa]SHO00914.1 DNA-directed DNA polymerase I [Moritella viscosa]SHO02623.1 DNA-directed DNA polymerase I [Moritella viscosa]
MISEKATSLVDSYNQGLLALNSDIIESLKCSILTIFYKIPEYYPESVNIWSGRPNGIDKLKHEIKKIFSNNEIKLFKDIENIKFDEIDFFHPLKKTIPFLCDVTAVNAGEYPKYYSNAIDRFVNDIFTEFKASRIIFHDSDYPRFTSLSISTFMILTPECKAKINDIIDIEKKIKTQLAYDTRLKRAESVKRAKEIWAIDIE